MQDEYLHQGVILVTCATGNIGKPLVQLLAQTAPRFEIRCATRDLETESARELLTFGSNVKVVEFDWKNENTFAKTFDKVTRLFLLAPINEDMVEWHRVVVDAAKKFGDLKFILKNSVVGARLPKEGEPAPGLVPRLHGESEEIVKKSGVPYALLRPTIFSQHFIQYSALYKKGDSKFYLPTGDGKIAFLDCRDIALLAAHILSEENTDAFNNQIYTLTGPAALSAKEIAQIISDCTGKPMEHVDIDSNSYAKRLDELTDLAPWNKSLLLSVYKDAKEGWLGKHISEDYQNVVGRRPTSFEQFVKDNITHFMP